MNQAAEIAQDALNQLAAEKLIAATSVYISPLEDLDRDDISGDDYLTTTCHVCAKGALVVGYMTRLGDETLGDVDERLGELSYIFDPQNFTLIEECFEGFHYSPNAVSLRYYQSIPDKDVRLELILENIVRNDGTFIPEQDLEQVAA